MNEKLIDRIVTLKLDAAGRLIDRMPEKLSAELKDTGMSILKSVNEKVQDMKEHPCEKSKPSDKINHVPID